MPTRAAVSSRAQEASRGSVHVAFIRRWLLLLCGVALPSVVLLDAAPARADVISDQILALKSSDLRVRTQAALALGASQSERAVLPLCGALADTSSTVRIAAAAALGKLARPSARSCLEKRLTLETTTSTKCTIRMALDSVAGVPRSDVTSSTKYYVAMGPTSHALGRHVDSVMRKGMASAGVRLGSFAFAPPCETPEQGQEVLKKHTQLKAFYLSPQVTTTYTGGTLKVTLAVAMLTYPGKAVIGQFSVSASAGVSAESAGAEDELIEVLGDAAMTKFAPVAARL